MKNRLSEYIAKKLPKLNEGIPARKKKWTRTQELVWLADQMGVRYETTRDWYHNVGQPAKPRMFELCKVYKAPFSKFFYDETNEKN